MADWQKIRKEYESGGITLKNLAEKHGVKDSTLRSRKNREKWGATQRKKNATQRKNVATGKRGAPLGNSNAKGNRGNPNASPPQRNTNALKHGLFSRYMPEETLKIMGMVAGSNPADLLWMQIELQFAAIIRSQQIMFVESKDEMIRELKKSKFDVVTTDDGIERIPTELEYEFQFAWDRQATFMQAQTKALSELRGAIKQFVSLADEEDERRLKLSIMAQQLVKLERENTPDNKTEDKLKTYFEALGGAFGGSAEP